jgi:hypothetical protein
MLLLLLTTGLTKGTDMNKNNDCRETGAKLGVGRSKVFELWGTGELKSITIGARRFSTDRQIEEFLADLEAGAERYRAEQASAV